MSSSERVDEYLRLLREQVAKRRAAPGGELSEDEEEEWAERCQAVYEQFTAEELEEARQGTS